MFREKMLKEGTWDLEDETNILWNKMGECVKRIAKGILGESRGKCPFCKDTWWWNEDVQNIVKIKQTSYKTWQKSRKEEDFERYKYVRKEAKKVIRDVKFKAYDNLYDKLGTKDGEKDVYKLDK